MCKMENCAGQVSRGCGYCSKVSEDCNCKDCTGDLCNGGEIENPFPKCYQQFPEMPIHAEKQCQYDRSCFMKNCDGDEKRGCGKCGRDEAECCKTCTADFCNGGPVKRLYPKCYMQNDFENSGFRWEHQYRSDTNNFCYMKNCDGIVKRGCGDYASSNIQGPADSYCNCISCTEDLCNEGEIEECNGELCNMDSGIYANGNSLVGTLIVMLLSSLMLGKLAF